MLDVLQMCNGKALAMKCHYAADVLGLLLLVVVSVCGAEVKVSCGSPVNKTVVSPGYPDAYPYNKSCNWVLPNATYMVLDKFYLQPGDVLVFYEGAVKKENIIANLTGQQDKLVVYSASENPTVIFKSKAKSGLASSRIRCFKLTYSLLAPHQHLTDNSGQIQSPVYKTGNGTVEWFYELNGLKGSTKRKVSLSADVVDIKHGSLVILSGDKSTLVNRTGRVNHLGDVFAKTLKMYVSLTLSTSVQQKFSAAFTSTTAACTKTVKLTSQKIFISPGYPSNYSGDLNCRWVIQSPPNTTIKVQFSDFRLADSYDHVILVDGDAKEDRSFGVYSHLNPPGSNFLLTSSNSLWLHFGTDESESAAGFNLTLEPLAHGGRFVDKGIISLDPTDDVESSEPVYFQLTVKDGQQVYLNFTNMWLGNSTATVTCYNSLSEDGAVIIARFSAASGPPSLPVYSSDNHMLVVASDFFTNNSLSEVMPHFTASFKAVPQDGLIQTSLETSGTYQLTAQSYPSQATWMLPNLGSQGKTTGVVALRIDSLVLGPHSRLTVYGGTGQQAPKVAEFTHSMTNAPVVYVPSARVVYSTRVNDTDSSNISMVLVRASYSLLSDCGGNLSLPSGVVTTPQYPNQYPFNANCTWRLPKLKSRKLHMALTDLVLVGNHSVRVLAVNITSVANHTRYVTTELASYSSNRSLPASDLLVENTDELWVNFQSTANGSGEVKVARGFQASYEDMKCGGRRSTDGVVNTPGFPKLVKGDTTCVWIISLPATTGKKPRIISFKYEIRPLLQIDTSNTIEIRDGASTLSQAIPVSMKAGKKMQYSRTSQLWIRYTYRKTKKHKGFAFKLTYKTYDCDHVCANGVCMLPDWKCNGIDECGDMSDEKNCTQPSPSKPGHGVSVGVLVAVIFIMFFLGIAVTLLIPIAYRRFRASRYRELHDMMTPAST